MCTFSLYCKNLRYSIFNAFIIVFYLETLDKVNHTMQEYYKITQQWRTEAAVRDQEYKKQLQDCQLQIDKLTKENRQLKLEVDSNLEQMRVVEELRQKEHDELRQSASEKSSLIENMRVEMDRLQKHQVVSHLSDNICVLNAYITMPSIRL